MPSTTVIFLSFVFYLTSTTTHAFKNCKPASPLEFQTATALQLAEKLVGTGVQIVSGSVTFSGNANIGDASQMSTFSGGASIFQNQDDMDTGIVLTTGNINEPICQAQGGGDIDSKTWSKGTIDPDLIKICKTFYNKNGLSSSIGNCDKYQDQAMLTFKFIVKARATMGIKYSFASEEWPDYVDNLYADGFAFFIDGTNIATTPDNQGVSIGSINCKSGSNAHNCNNCNLYLNNGGGVDSGCSGAVSAAPNQGKFSYNGYTHVLRGEKLLEPGEHTIKMVVADMLDGAYDSSVFIAARSLVAANPMCYSVTQIGQCSLKKGFQETFVKPVIRFVNDHPFMTRSDCGGAPGTNMIPGEGKKLNGNCVDKNTGGELFYAYDPTTKSDRTKLSIDHTALMYVVRDTYERAYLVVSLGKPNLLNGQLEASTVMQFRLVNVTGTPSPIVKDDPIGDSYNWNTNTLRGRFNWRWRKTETDGVVLGPFIEGEHGWCVEWNMEELSPKQAITHFKFGSMDNGVFKTDVEINKEMFDIGGGKGVRLCGCAGTVDLKGIASCNSCRIASECGDSTSGGTGSGLGGSTSGDSSKGTGNAGSSSNTKTKTGGNGKSGGGISGTNSTNTTSALDLKNSSNTTMIIGILFSVVGCCCFVIIAIVLFQRNKTKKEGNQSPAVGIEMKNVAHDVTSQESIEARELLSVELEGSQWWYVDLEGVEQGPFETSEMIAWAEWDYLNAAMWVYEIPTNSTVEDGMESEIEYVELSESRLQSFLGVQTQEKEEIQIFSTPESIEFANMNPMGVPENTRTLSKKLSMHPTMKPRGTMLARGSVYSVDKPMSFNGSGKIDCSKPLW